VKSVRFVAEQLSRLDVVGLKLQPSSAVGAVTSLSIVPKVDSSGDVSGMHSIRIQTMSNISAEMLARGPVTKHRAEMGGQARARGAGPGCCRIQR
jgi:hypothetical protein